MAAHTQTSLTPEQYLELDNLLETRHEYYNGRMYAKAGRTYNYGRIIGNMTGAFYVAFRGRPCDAIPNDMRLRVASDGLYTYPDIVVVCGEPELLRVHGETLVNPTLLVEVLSGSTEAYDRGFKAAQYRKLVSLKEYAFVSQDEPRIEIMRRDGRDWRLTDYCGLEAVCHFESIECEMALADIYHRVAFPEPKTGSGFPTPALG